MPFSHCPVGRYCDAMLEGVLEHVQVDEQVAGCCRGQGTCKDEGTEGYYSVSRGAAKLLTPSGLCTPWSSPNSIQPNPKSQDTATFNHHTNFAFAFASQLHRVFPS